MGFKTVAIAAVVMVIYEAIKKVVEFRGRLEELCIVSERESASYGDSPIHKSSPTTK